MRLVLGALLALALALQAAVVVDSAGGARLELGRHRRSVLAPATRARLAALERPVTLTYYVSPSARMPSSMRRVEREVREVLERIAAAAPGVVRWRALDPEADEERMRFATRRRVAPYRVRGVTRDAFAETPVYSSLELVDASGQAALIDGIGPELVPRLAALVVEHLELFERPERPRVALAAPAAGYDGLRAALGELAEVREVELEQVDALEGVDALVWLAPGSPSAPGAPSDGAPSDGAPSDGVLARVETFRSAGGGLLIAGSSREPRAGDIAGTPAFALSPTGFEPERVWRAFGLGVRADPLFDELCEAQVFDDAPVPLPFLVRCIGQNQDFRELPRQPAGSLLFAGPTPFAPSDEELFERGLELRVLGTSSENSFSLPELAGVAEPPPMPLTDAVAERGDALPKQPLIVQVLPSDPWQGPLFALSAPTPFQDPYFAFEGYAHRALLEVLVGELGSNERLVAARADVPRPVPIGAVSRTAELGWRALALGGLPLALLVFGMVRGNPLRSDAPRSSGSRVRAALRTAALPAAACGLLLAVGIAARALPAGFGRTALAEADSASALLLEPETVRLAATATSGRDDPLRFEWVQSRSDLLSPALRSPSRRALALLRELARVTPGAEVARVIPDADEADELAQRGIATFPDAAVEDGETRVRRIYSTLVVRAGDASEQLDFPDARSFEDFEFRVAFALWRLSGNAVPRIALATDSPRLSPAEAHTEFQQRKLFAPSGVDVYSLARASLERADFEVVHVEPKAGAVPADADALFWLQPRRTITAMLDGFVEHLRRGRPAFVAVQHFVIRAERHRGRDFTDVYWPQPQMPDVESLWFPDLGLTLAREVLFDELRFEAPLRTHVNRTGEERDYRDQSSTAGFLVRASAEHHADDPLLAGVGDLDLPFPNAFALDAERIAAAGLQVDVLARTTPEAWSYPWRGGFLEDSVLSGSGDAAPPVPESRQGLGAPLMLRVRGSFGAFVPPPPPGERPEEPDPTAAPPDGAPEATLLLFGNTEALKDERLAAPQPTARADRLLVNAAAELCLPPALARLAGLRSVPRGLGIVSQPARLTWRAGVLGLPLVGVLAAAGAWLLISRAARRGALRRVAEAPAPAPGSPAEVRP